MKKLRLQIGNMPSQMPCLEPNLNALKCLGQRGDGTMRDVTDKLTLFVKNQKLPLTILILKTRDVLLGGLDTKIGVTNLNKIHKHGMLLNRDATEKERP